MPTTKPTTVDDYLASLPDDRRAEVSAIRQVILANLPEGYEETVQYGMIAYVVPHSLYPAGYHCDPKQPLPLAALGSNKTGISLHLMPLYGDKATEDWFRSEYAATGKKLDMGKACVRFKKLADVPLELIGRAFARIPAQAYIDHTEQFLLASGRKKAK